jgi:hypothetical protein
MKLLKQARATMAALDVKQQYSTFDQDQEAVH